LKRKDVKENSVDRLG